MNRDIYEAHVQFELQRWRDSLHEEVEAAWAWLEGVRIGDVLTAELVTEWLDTWPGPDVQLARDLHAAALQDPTTLDELVTREDYNRLATIAMGLKDLQDSLVEQITTSDVYAELITHVLYHGIKNYVMTESPVAKVPGASAFMKFGQSAMDRGVPSLSKGIDRQLMNFVNANISDSLRESRAYLTTAVDTAAMTEVSGEIWNRNANVTVAELASLIPLEAVVEAAEVARHMWEHLRGAPAFRDEVTRWVTDNSDRPVTDLLTQAGGSPEQIETLLIPWVAQAEQDGFLEARIRARLEPFYAQLD